MGKAARAGRPAMNSSREQPADQQKSPDELRQEIEDTREELGDTVEALAEKADVKAQAKARIDSVKDAAQQKKDEMTAKIKSATPESAAAGAQQAATTAKRNPLPLAAGGGLPGRLRDRTDQLALIEEAEMGDQIAQEPRREAGARQRAPESPAKLGAGSWFGVLRRSARGFSADNLTDRAAALTYYGIQAIFPALLALVSILGLVGRSATQPLIQNLDKVAPGPAQKIFTSAIENLEKSQGAAGVLVFVGIGVALWSASGYVGAFMRASNDIYGVTEGRPFWLKRPLQVLVTFVLVMLLAVSALAVVLTGGLATQVGKVLGIGQSAVTVWDIAKWPVLVLIVSLMFAILYWAAPNVRHPGFRWLTPGGILAVLLWIIASAAFALYVANFASYNKTYGSLGGIIVFLVWLWISNVVVLFGAELNSELERGRELEAGEPAEDELQVTPRMAAKGE